MKHQIPVLGETVTISWLGAGAGMRGTFAIVGSLNDAHEQPQTEDGVLVSQISNLILGAGGSFTYFLPHYHGRAMLTFFPVAGTMRCYGVVEDEAGGALAYLFLREGIVAGDSRGPLEFATTPQVNRVTVVDSGGAGATFQLSVIAIGGRGADN